MRENMYKYVAKASIPGKQKRSLSCRGKALFSCGLIAALLFLPQAVWAAIPEGTASGNAIAIGNNSEATGVNSIALGSNSVASEANTVSVGGNGTTRRIVNVADGTEDNDAATVGQINSGITALGSSISDALGGSSEFANGKVTAKFTINGQPYYNVQSALDAVNAGFENVVQYDDDSKTAITLNNGGGPVKITNVAEGDITETSKDAVTGGQLYSVQQEVTDINNRVTNTEDAIVSIQGSIKNGVQYDDDSKKTVTLNSAGEPVKITNVADGDITENSTDAVTGGQLNATNQKVADAETNITNIQADVAELTSNYSTLDANAVQYDDATKGKITLRTNGLTQIANVAAGVDDTDAVNVGQLNSLGSSISNALGGSSAFANGEVTAKFTINSQTYDNVQSALDAVNLEIGNATANAVNYDDATKNKITLAGTKGSQIANVADGVADTDAVNVRQLNSGVKAGLASLGSDVAHIIGTNVGYDGDNFSGAINIGGKEYYTVESALNALYNGTAGSTGGAVGGDEIEIDPNKGAITMAEGGNIQITQNGADANKFTVSVSTTPTFTAVYADNASIGGITIDSGGISLGGKKITGLADGYADTDAVNVRQLTSLGTSVKNTIGSEVARVIGSGLSYSGDSFSGGLTVGSSTYTTVQDALNALYNNNTAGGSGTQNPGGGTIDITANVTIEEGNNIKISEMTAGKYIIGVSESPMFNTVSASNATIGGMTMNSDGITMGGKQITGLAGGNIAKDSADAVTGGQLYSLGSSISNALGGSSEFKDGKVTAEFKINDQTYYNVQDAINAVNDGFENVVQYDDDNKATITLNKGGEATQVTNVADGRVAAGSRDAVTGNQLYQAYQRMNDLDKSIDVVGAHAAAMSALHPVPYNKYEPTTFSAGVGTYHDECAMAIGAFHYIRPNLMVNVGASVCSDGDVMGRIGLSVALGKSTRKQPELAHDVAGMQEQMSVMQAKLTELEEQNRRDKEIIQKNAEIMAQNERIIRELMQKYEAK